MNDEHEQHRPRRSRPDTETESRGDAPGRGDEGEVSALARHRDPSQAKATQEKAAKPGRGVEWVRPTDLIASRTSRVAGRGIDFHAELARRGRRLPGQAYRVTRSGVRGGARVMSERARKLPPVSAFGRGGGTQFSWVSRSGIGLG